MGYADADVRHAASSAGAEEEGFRASFIRKRHSLFGRPEPMSSFDLSPPPPSSSNLPIQGVLYHDLASSGEQQTTNAPESKRRSFFGGRFKFGSNKKDHNPPPAPSAPTSSRDSSPPKSALTAHAQYQRGAASTTDLSDRGHISEDEYYRNHTKKSISPPFNFQHVTHTHKKHLPALETVDEKDLTKEFWAVSAHQAPQSRLKGIQADSIPSKTETMGLIRGATSSQTKLQKLPPPPTGLLQDKPASSSREDITALPGLGKAPKRSASRSRRDDFSSLLGLRDKGGSSSSEQGQARKDTYNALLGIDETAAQPVSPISSTKDDIGSLLGFSALSTKQSADSYRSANERPQLAENKRTSFTSKLAWLAGDGHSSRRDMGSVLSMWEADLTDEVAQTSPKAKDDASSSPVNKDDSKNKRHSKQSTSKDASKDKIEEIDALLGMPKRKAKTFEPMAPPPPPRPRRSDEELRQGSSPALSSTSMQPPDRPRRDSKDVQYLREMGFGQLLYRENSNETRTSAQMQRESSSDSIYSRTMHRQSATDLRNSQISMHRQASSEGQTMVRQGSNDSRHSQVFMAQSQHPPALLNDTYQARSYEYDQHAYNAASEDAARANQVSYRSRQPLPSIPRPNNISPEGRSPLQTVSEIGESHSPLRTPTDSALSPHSPNSIRSANRTIRSPELTGPSMPDDGTWENEIDYLYSKEAEANHEFDWEVSMTPQRLSVRDPDKRLSLNVPSGMPSARLSKKLSEGSLRSSIYMPSALNIQPHASRQYQQEPPKAVSHVDEYTTAGARASPEVRVYDVDDQRQDSAYPAGALHMHGYESLAQGYLSDPESNSEQSQHRKSNSYSSWESRPSNTREHARYSNASINNVPELTFTRQRKQPITHIPTQSAPTYSSDAMNEYAAFSRGPYDSQPPPDFQHRRPETIGQTAMLRATANRARDQTPGWARQAPASPSPQTHRQPQQQQSGWI